MVVLGIAEVVGLVIHLVVLMMGDWKQRYTWMERVMCASLLEDNS